MRGMARLFALLVAGCQIAGCSHATTQTPSPLPSLQSTSEMQAATMFHRLNHIRDQERGEVLSALTPDQRHLVSSLLGQLAVAQHPDVPAAARMLDSELTPAQKQSIRSASARLRDRYHAMIDELARQASPSGARVFHRDYFAAPEDPGMTVLLLLTESLSAQTSLAAQGVL